MNHVTAMSISRGEALKKIGNFAPKLAEHIIKIFLYPDCKYVKGWTREIKTWYSDIGFLGNHMKKGARLKHDDYYDVLILPVSGPSFKKLYKSVVINNPELTTTRYPLKDLPILDSLVTGLYLNMATCLENDRSWLDFVESLKTLTHIP